MVVIKNREAATIPYIRITLALIDICAKCYLHYLFHIKIDFL